MVIDPEMDAKRDTALQLQRPCLQNTKKHTQQTDIETQAHGRKCEHRKIHKRVWVHAWTHTNTHTRDHEPPDTPRPRIPCHTCKYMLVHTTDQAQTHATRVKATERQTWTLRLTHR